MLGSVSKDHQETAAASHGDKESSSATETNFIHYINVANKKIVAGRSELPEAKTGNTQQSQNFVSPSAENPAEKSSPTLTKKLVSQYLPPSPSTGTSKPTGQKTEEATQPSEIPSELVEGYEEAKGTDSAGALEHYKDIEEPQDAGGGFIRFTTKDGKKFYVKASTNPQFFRQMTTFYNVRQTLEKYPDHERIKDESALPSIKDFSKQDQIKEAGNGVLVYETNDGKKGIIFNDLNPKLYTAALGLHDAVSEQAHAEASSEIPKEYEFVTDKTVVPPFSEIRHIKEVTVSDGSKILLYTTNENKKYAVSSIKNPQIFNELSRYFVSAQQIGTLKEAGYTPITEQSQEYPDVKDIKKAGWSGGLKSGVTGYELKSGEKFAITAQDNPDLYAHIQGVNEYLSAPDSHREKVESLRKDGYTLADIGTGTVALHNIKTIEIAQNSERADPNNVQLSDPRTGIITITTNDGKKIVVSERLTPFAFEDLLGKSQTQAKISEYAEKGFEWADEKTPAPAIDEKVEMEPIQGAIDPQTGQPKVDVYAVTIGDKKYLMSPEQFSPEDEKIMTEYNTAIQNNETPSKELQEKIKKIKPIPFVQGMMDNFALTNLPDEAQTKIKALHNAKDTNLLTPSNPVITVEKMSDKSFPDKIKDIDTSAAEDDGIITFTLDGKQHAVSRDLTPQEFAYIEGIGANRSGMEKSISEGYRKANDGDFEPDIKETSKPGEFGQGIMRFTTESGEKIVVSAEKDPYLFNLAMTAYKENVGKEIDSVWEKYDLPDRKEFSIANLPSKVVENGKPKSVHSIAFGEVLGQYAEMNKNGELSADDPRAKLLRLLGHEQLLTGGMEIVPYIEKHGARVGNDTVRKHKKDKSGNGQMIRLTKADMAELIDGPGLENALQDLLQKDPIAKDINTAFTKSINLNVDKKGAVDQVYEQIKNPDFVNALTDLKLSGNDEAITQITDEILAPIAIIMKENPEELQKLQMEITNSLTINIMERNLQDPGTISQETKDIANKDASQYTVKNIKYAIENAPGIEDKPLLELKEYLSNEANVKKVETGIEEFVTFAQKNPELDSGQAALKFIEAKSADGKTSEQDITALKTTLIVMENSNYTNKLLSLAQIGGALYTTFDNGKDIAPDAIARMDFIENTMVPMASEHFITGEKTKELLVPYSENGTKPSNSQNMSARPEGTVGDQQARALKDQAAAQMNVMAMMNSWQMNIGQGSLEALMGVLSFTGQRDFIKEGLENEQAYGLYTTGEIAMLGAGAGLGIYGILQAGVKYAPSSVVEKYSPTITKLDESLNNPLSNVTNSVQMVSSVMFGFGMMGMGIAGMFSKHPDKLSDAGNSLSAIGGATIMASGGMQGAGMYATATVNRAAAIMQANTSGATVAKAGNISKALGIEKRAQNLASPSGGSKGAAYTSRAATIANLGAKLGIAGLAIGTVAGTVFGAQMINAGVKTDDTWMQVAGGLNVAGSVVAGAATLAAMVMGSITLAAVGIVAFIPGLIVSLLLDEIRGNPQLKRINDDENIALNNLDADGFLREGAREKFEFARYYMYHEGRKELNDDESFIETQQEMWDHFEETPKKNGSSENRLDWDLHNEKEQS